MSRQTDELMGMFEQTDETPAEELTKQLREVGEMKERLRLLETLRLSPAFEVFTTYLQSEKGRAFNAMERTIDPVAQSKFLGAYCALARCIEFVPSEIAQIKQDLSEK